MAWSSQVASNLARPIGRILLLYTGSPALFKPFARDALLFRAVPRRRANLAGKQGLGRSLRHLLETVSGLESAGVGFRSLEESLDTTTTGGRLVFHVFGAISEFERDVIRERTQAGLAAARARGRRGGRPRALSPEQVTMARAMLADASTPVRSVYTTLGVGRTTLYRYISESAGPAGEAAGREGTGIREHAPAFAHQAQIREVTVTNPAHRCKRALGPPVRPGRPSRPNRRVPRGHPQSRSP